MRTLADLAGSNGQRRDMRMLPPGVIQSFGGHVADWVRTCADYYAAAAMYEQLSRLSDAELQRRGLSRASLGRDVCVARCAGRTPGNTELAF